jgi:hypothetical protein
VATEGNKPFLGRDIILIQAFEHADISRLARCDVHHAHWSTTVLNGLQNFAIRRVIVTHQRTILNAKAIAPEGKSAGYIFARSWGSSNGVGNDD